MIVLNLKLIIVSDWRFSETVLRRFGIDRLRRLVRTNLNLRKKFKLESSTVKKLTVDQCVNFLIDFKKEMFQQTSNTE